MASTVERIAKINADLRFILDNNSVPPQTQAKLADDGFTTIRLFSNIAESKATQVLGGFRQLFCRPGTAHASSAAKRLSFGLRPVSWGSGALPPFRSAQPCVS
eukprot:4845789-Amphidinium_carterae.1